jgi:hypothetical protein
MAARQPFDLPTEGNLSVGVETDDMKDLLADVDADRRRRCDLCSGFYGLLLLPFAGNSLCRLTRRRSSRFTPLAEVRFRSAELTPMTQGCRSVARS